MNAKLISLQKPLTEVINELRLLQRNLHSMKVLLLYRPHFILDIFNQIQKACSSRNPVFESRDTK